MTNETISEKCETLYNKLNAFVTSVISRDVTPKISNLNTEVWGSDTQTGNSRIDTLNTKFDNLDGSITSMESDINNVESDVSNLQTSVNSLSDSLTNLEKVFFTTITPSAITSASTWKNVNNGKIRLHRVGNICILSGLFQLKAKYPSTGWKQIATLPIGYKSDYTVELRNAALSDGKIADKLQVSEYNVNIYCGAANKESTEYVSFDLVWVTNDDYPSQ